MLVAVKIPRLLTTSSAQKAKFHALRNPAHGPIACLVHWYTPPSCGHSLTQYVTTSASGTNRKMIPPIQNHSCVPPCLAAIPHHVTPTTSRICIGTRSRSRSSFFNPCCCAPVSRLTRMSSKCPQNEVVKNQNVVVKINSQGSSAQVSVLQGRGFSRALESLALRRLAAAAMLRTYAEVPSIIKSEICIDNLKNELDDFGIFVAKVRL